MNRQRASTQTLWLKIHLYLALSVGFLFALIGLSGSLCVYQEELDQLFNPELTIQASSAPYQSLDKIMAAVNAEHPHRNGSWTLEMPGTAQGVITAWFEKPRETFFEDYAPLMVSVNPYTAEIISSRFWGSTLATWLLNLHSQLLLGNTGSTLIGGVGLLLCISSITGLYLWWPGVQNIRQAFKFRPNSTMMQLCFDLHRWIGLLCVVFMLILALTGVLLSYPEFLESVFDTSGMAHGQTGRTIISTAEPKANSTSLAGAVFIARAPFPRAQLRRVTTPVGDAGIYRINLRQAQEVNQRHPYTTVWIDRWSGQIKEVRDPYQFSFGENLNAWIWPVHTGEALGSTGRLLWFIAGQGIFLLYISGLMLWLFRKQKFNDRKINYSALRAAVYRLSTRIYRYALLGLRHIALWLMYLKRYQPVIKREYQAWLQRLGMGTK